MFEGFLEWKFVDFDMSAHTNGVDLWVGEEGRVVRWSLFPGSRKSILVPKVLREMNRKKRKELARKLNFNWVGKGNVFGVGKPSSAFLGKNRNGSLFIDFFLESWSHKRKKGTRLHDFIRQNLNYSGIRPLDGASMLRSGHIAPLNITEAEVGFILLLDHLSDSRWVGDMSVLETLWFNRILVVSSNGYLVGVERGEELLLQE